MLAFLCLTFAFFSAPLPTESTPLPEDWRVVSGLTGATISLPRSLELVHIEGTPPPNLSPQVTHQGSGPVISELYGDTDWGVGMSVREIPPNESKDDAESMRIEQIAYDIINLDPSSKTALQHYSVSKVEYSAFQGWPSVDLDVSSPEKSIEVEGKSYPVQGLTHLRIVRGKEKDFILILYGAPKPEDENLVLQSFVLPKSFEKGSLEKWGPEAKDQSIADLVDVWAPCEFKEDSDPDSEDTRTFSSEFGYMDISITVTTLPKGTGSQYDRDQMRQIVQSEADDLSDDDGKVTLSAIDTYTSNNDLFYFATYNQGTADGRIDAVVKGDKLFLFSISVPHGLLDSKPIKRFIASYSLR